MKFSYKSLIGILGLSSLFYAKQIPAQNIQEIMDYVRRHPTNIVRFYPTKVKTYKTLDEKFWESKNLEEIEKEEVKALIGTSVPSDSLKNALSLTERVSFEYDINLNPLKNWTTNVNVSLFIKSKTKKQLTTTFQSIDGSKVSVIECEDAEKRNEGSIDGIPEYFTIQFSKEKNPELWDNKKGLEERGMHIKFVEQGRTIHWEYQRILGALEVDINYKVLLEILEKKRY